MKTLCILILCLLPGMKNLAQGIAINSDGAAADTSAMLDIRSTTKGLLLPRMTAAQRDLIGSPASGLMIYQTDNAPGLYMYDGVSWSTLTMAPDVWGISGNTGTNPTTDFIGTSDNNPLRFRLNNKWAGELNYISGNACLGDSAGVMMTSGYSNTSFGHKSFKKNTTGERNVAVGYRSLMNNLNGELNTAVGHNSLQNNGSGYENTAIGSGSLVTNVTGSRNTAVGAAALLNNTFYGNTAIGAYSLYNNTASENTAVGTHSLFLNSIGLYNTAVGTYSLYQNLSGYYNTAIGHSALYTSTGDFNTALGSHALRYNENGYHNSAIGAFALQFNTTGHSNTAVGKEALYNSTTSIYNTTIGLRSAYHTTTGGSNVATGFWSLYNNTTGAANTALGNEALAYNYTGSYNVAVGAFSGGVNSVTNTISIGNHGYGNSANNQSFTGNLSTSWIGGNVTWSTFSDARVKTNIREDVKGLDFITRLRPVTYHRDIDMQTQLTGNKPTEDYPDKYDIEQIKFSGFLAQEVEQAAFESGYNFSGITAPRNEHEVYTLSYESFVVPLVKSVQELVVQIDEQRAVIASQSDQIQNQKMLIVQQRTQYELQLRQNTLLEKRMADLELAFKSHVQQEDVKQ